MARDLDVGPCRSLSGKPNRSLFPRQLGPPAPQPAFEDMTAVNFHGLLALLPFPRLQFQPPSPPLVGQFPKALAVGDLDFSRTSFVCLVGPAVGSQELGQESQLGYAGTCCTLKIS